MAPGRTFRKKLRLLCVSFQHIRTVICTIDGSPAFPKKFKLLPVLFQQISSVVRIVRKNTSSVFICGLSWQYVNSPDRTSVVIVAVQVEVYNTITESFDCSLYPT